jgi:hypothetical protein
LSLPESHAGKEEEERYVTIDDKVYQHDSFGPGGPPSGGATSSLCLR